MEQVLNDFEFAISMARPHGGTGVNKLCEYIVDRLADYDVSVDFSGNIHVDFRGDTGSRTLFTAHVDTVHRADGDNYYRYVDNFIVADNADNSPLGADDAAGVAILLHMIESNVPGYYIFFQGEEKGGIGSGWLALNREDLLMQFDRAIAFDRKSTYSVITHQMCGRCCSEEFAEALTVALNEADSNFMYIPDDSGLYTDTAEFISVIPECTNISVGYYHEHTQNEKIDVDHFLNLASAVVAIDWEALPVSRDPKSVEPIVTYTTPPYYDYTKHPQYNKYLSHDDAATQADKDIADLYKGTSLVDALGDAKAGLKYDLLYVLAEYTMPDDPEMALRYFDRSKITEDLILDAEKMLAAGYSETHVIEYLFDMIYQN